MKKSKIIIAILLLATILATVTHTPFATAEKKEENDHAIVPEFELTPYEDILYADRIMEEHENRINGSAYLCSHEVYYEVYGYEYVGDPICSPERCEDDVVIYCRGFDDSLYKEIVSPHGVVSVISIAEEEYLAYIESTFYEDGSISENYTLGIDEYGYIVVTYESIGDEADCVNQESIIDNDEAIIMRANCSNHLWPSTWSSSQQFCWRQCTRLVNSVRCTSIETRNHLSTEDIDVNATVHRSQCSGCKYSYGNYDHTWGPWVQTGTSTFRRKCEGPNLRGCGRIQYA